jgi:hypothetical protein
MNARQMNKDELAAMVVQLRSKLEPAFGPDTASAVTKSDVPSAGQCAAAAVLVSLALDGGFASAVVGGQSHWFSRVETTSGVFDVDVTGDQFGRQETQVADAGALYPDTRERTWDDLTQETLRRALVLARRAHFNDVEGPLRGRLNSIVPTT